MNRVGALDIPHDARPERPAGWDLRFCEQVRLALGRGYHVRDWNCARFAHTCAEAVIGRAIPYRWLGALAESVDAVLPRLVNHRFAQRGDVVLASVPAPSLGVCSGRYGLFVTARGLLELPMDRVSAVWVV